MDKSVGSFREMEKRSFLKITEKRFKNSNELGKNKVFLLNAPIYSNKLLKNNISDLFIQTNL